MPTSLLLHCCSPTPTHSNLQWQVFLILHPLEFRWYISFKVPFFSQLLSRSPRPFSLKNDVPRLRVFTTRCMSFGQKYQRLLTWHTTPSLLSHRCIFSHSNFFSLSSCTQTQHTFAVHLPRGLLPHSKPNDVLMRRCVWHPPIPPISSSFCFCRLLPAVGGLLWRLRKTIVHVYV